MPNDTKRVREEQRLRPAHRRMLRTFDHDCEGGHGPECEPTSVHYSYWLDGEQITDPGMIARIDAQIEEG